MPSKNEKGSYAKFKICNTFYLKFFTSSNEITEKIK